MWIDNKSSTCGMHNDISHTELSGTGPFLPSSYQFIYICIGIFIVMEFMVLLFNSFIVLLMSIIFTIIELWFCQITTAGFYRRDFLSR